MSHGLNLFFREQRTQVDPLIPVRELLDAAVRFDISHPVAPQTVEADLQKQASVVVQAYAMLLVLLVNNIKVEQPAVVIDIVNLLFGV